MADTHPKPRLLLIGSLCLAIAFLTFSLSPSYWINLGIMFLFGVGMGAYEGVTDAMLLDLHEARAGLFVNVNHFFVTFGSLLIALYLIFPQMSWQVAVVQCGIGVLLLAGVFALTSLQNKPRPVSSYSDKLGILTKDVVIGLLFFTTALIVGAEAGSIGIISTYLAEVRGFPPTLAQLGLVVFLVAVAAGRLIVGFAVRPKQILGFTLALFGLAVPTSAVFYFVDLGSYTYMAAMLMGLTLSALLPLVLTFTGLLYEEMAGTASGRRQDRDSARRHRAAPDHVADRQQNLAPSIADRLPNLVPVGLPARARHHVHGRQTPRDRLTASAIRLQFTDKMDLHFTTRQGAYPCHDRSPFSPANGPT